MTRTFLFFIEDVDEAFDVEDTMSSITERWLLVEEVLEQRRDNQMENDRVLQISICGKEIDDILNTVTKLNSAEEQNEETLSKFQVINDVCVYDEMNPLIVFNFYQAILRMANDQVTALSPADSENCERLISALDLLKSKVNQLELKISDFEKGKRETSHR